MTIQEQDKKFPVGYEPVVFLPDFIHRNYGTNGEDYVIPGVVRIKSTKWQSRLLPTNNDCLFV